MTSSKTRRSIRRAAAMLLASVLGVIGVFGDGLHALSHRTCHSASHCAPNTGHDSSVAVAASCSCTSCPGAVSQESTKGRTSDRCVTGLTAPIEGWSAPRPVGPWHDHDCAVCRLLAVVGQSVEEAPPAITLPMTALLIERLVDQVAESSVCLASRARGPPVVA